MARGRLEGRVAVLPGKGLVHRRTEVLLVVPDPAAGSPHALAALVAICTDPPDGAERVRRLAGLVAEAAPGEVPPFAALVVGDVSVVAVAHGGVGVGAGAPAAEAPVWVERVLTPPLGAVPVGVHPTNDGTGQAPALLDLRDGTVPGGGAVLYAADAPSAAYRTPAVGGQEPTSLTTSHTVLRRTVPVRSVPLAGSERRRPRGRREPLPVGEPPRGEGTSRYAPVVAVDGVLCALGHLNEPGTSHCGPCGAVLDPAAPVVRGPRPPLGVLVTDQGLVFTVASDLVLGRAPDQAPEVREGRARPVLLEDAEHGTSRVHARVRLDGWQVVVCDAGSANGTFVSTSGAAGPWTAADPGGTRLQPGDRVRLGRRQVMFERWHMPPARARQAGEGVAGGPRR